MLLISCSKPCFGELIDEGVRHIYPSSVLLESSATSILKDLQLGLVGSATESPTMLRKSAGSE